MKTQIANSKVAKLVLTGLSLLVLQVQVASAANCQHPYCATSGAYDAERGYSGNLPESNAAAPAPAGEQSSAPGRYCYQGNCYIPSSATGGAVAQTEQNIRVVLALRFQAQPSDSELDQIAASFNALGNDITDIDSLDSGLNDGTQIDAKFGYLLMATFQTTEARDAFLASPAYAQFKGALGATAEQIKVLKLN